MKNLKKYRKIFAWFSVILWMTVIFYLSGMNTMESNHQSKNTINKIMDAALQTTNSIGITNTHPTKQKKQNLIEQLNKPLRKCAHASVYFFLAILLLHASQMSHFKFRKNYFTIILLTLLICFFYAVTDEYHQTFVTGRTGQFSDVLIDTIGAFVGITFYSAIRYLKKKKSHWPKFFMNFFFICQKYWKRIFLGQKRWSLGKR